MANRADTSEGQARVLQRSNPEIMTDVITQQADLTYYPMVDRFKTPDTDLAASADSNQAVWEQFFRGELDDTRYVTLEHFHLFEWFPLSPGRYHTQEAERWRYEAQYALQQRPDGRSYSDPYGKAQMIRGGIGAVRLRPRRINDEPHYFMSASATGICHEGFPVLIPREIYRTVMPQLKREGAVPVNLSGEMCYPTVELPTLFGLRREIPHLYLLVNQCQILPRPREAVTAFRVSGAVSFKGHVEEAFETDELSVYLTYATFDPASPASLEQACRWIEQFYVHEQHQGEVITDFDERPPRPRFQNATFGLPHLMAGDLVFPEIEAILRDLEIRPDAQAIQVFIDQYQQINTSGGAYIGGDVDTGGGDLVGRDRIVRPEDR